MNAKRTRLNRNTSLRSRKPLRRKTRIKAKRATPRRSGRVRDRAYLLAVKGLPCCLAWDAIAAGYAERRDGDRCEGPVEADHAGTRPLGRKADDDTAIPLCRRHHTQRHDHAGPFAQLTYGLMRRWCDVIIAETRARLGWKQAA